MMTSIRVAKRKADIGFAFINVNIALALISVFCSIKKQRILVLSPDGMPIHLWLLPPGEISYENDGDTRRTFLDVWVPLRVFTFKGTDSKKI